MAKFKTSIIIDEEVWKDTKVYCAKEGMLISTFIENILREELSKHDD